MLPVITDRNDGATIIRNRHRLGSVTGHLNYSTVKTHFYIMEMFELLAMSAVVCDGAVAPRRVDVSSGA